MRADGTRAGEGDVDDAKQQRTDRILDFLVDKGLVGCLVCRHGQFGVGSECFIMHTEHFDDPSEASSVVPVMCANCGYMMLFGTRMLPNEGQ
jgi:hypothetical protein